jgi:hypothetical protein
MYLRLLSLCPCVCCLLSDRMKMKAALEMYWSICILVLNFLYLSLVRGMLSIFDCSADSDGVRFLDADPSIPCDEVGPVIDCATAHGPALPAVPRTDFNRLATPSHTPVGLFLAGPQPGGIQQRMKAWGFVSMVAYTIGLPALFSWILFTNRAAIQRDQQLRAELRGAVAEENPDLHVRTRFQELYWYACIQRCTRCPSLC